MTDHDRHVYGEWDMFARDTGRARASLEAVAELEVKRVLDVGCGGGQELLPFIAHRNAFGIGVDIAPQTGQIGRRLFAERGYADRIVFLRAAAESLPLESGSVDVVICRVVLPLTDNHRTLAEIGRVLRPGGIFILKIHHARYYIQRLVRGLKTRHLSAIHAARALVAGAIYHVTGRQPCNRLTGREIFQTRWMLQRKLADQGLTIRSEMAGSDSNPLSPVFIIVKENVARVSK